MAARAAEELFSAYKGQIGSLNLISSGGGRFEVEVDGDLIYSKAANGRHANEGELLELFASKTGMATVTEG